MHIGLIKELRETCDVKYDCDSISRMTSLRLKMLGTMYNFSHLFLQYASLD